MGDDRHYQYTIEVSADSRSWQKVVDASGNTEKTSPQGYRHTIPSTRARYIRVTMLKNTANPAVHICELRAYEAKKANGPKRCATARGVRHFMVHKCSNLVAAKLLSFAGLAGAADAARAIPAATTEPAPVPRVPSPRGDVEVGKIRLRVMKSIARLLIRQLSVYDVTPRSS